MSATTVNIAVIDDHPLLREGVSSTLQSVDGFDVIDQGESYQDALRIAHEAMPDIILLDISMPGGGVEAAGAAMVLSRAFASLSFNRDLLPSASNGNSSSRS